VRVIEKVLAGRATVAWSFEGGVHFQIGDCLKEIEETEYWRELLVDSGCIPGTKMGDLLDETRQLIAIFTTIDKHSKDGL
jgi:hypothetical protein